MRRLGGDQQRRRWSHEVSGALRQRDHGGVLPVAIPLAGAPAGVPELRRDRFTDTPGAVGRLPETRWRGLDPRIV